MTTHMARPRHQRTLATYLRALEKIVALGAALGLWWIAAVTTWTGLTGAPGYLGIGIVLAFLALGIAVVGWRQSDL